MSSVDGRRRRVAAHYLGSDSSTARIRMTVDLAARTLDFPIAQLNVFDDTSEHTLIGVGIAEGVSYPRDQTFCQHVVDSGRTLGVADARLDARLAGLAAVQARRALSYIGVPLRSRESTVIGTLCVLDDRPRPISDDQIRQLESFGQIVEDQLDLMRRTSDRGLSSQTATADIVRAIERGEIRPWYQPIVDLRTGATSSYEALARWEHEDGTTTRPDRFLRGAEDSDVVLDVDLAVLDRAVSDLRRWRRARPDLRVNVNLSTRHLSVDGGVAEIESTVARSGVPPEAVTLELTETHELTDVAAATEAVLRLRRAGFGVVLDDFGSGWSSLDWILTLPVTGLKVDRSVTAALGGPVGAAIFRGISGLAADLDLSLTIEGVDGERHLGLARSLGCAYGQGFLWSPPQPVALIDAGTVALNR